MTAVIIGISLGLLIILLFIILKQFDKTVIYGLILAGIGFLYVGFVWTDRRDLLINSAQAVLFVFIAYYGIQKSINVLAAGFFLHGVLDITYSLFRDDALIPPNYDLFCLTIDFVIGIYIFLYRKKFTVKKSIL